MERHWFIRSERIIYGLLILLLSNKLATLYAQNSFLWYVEYLRAQIPKKDQKWQLLICLVYLCKILRGGGKVHSWHQHANNQAYLISHTKWIGLLNKLNIFQRCWNYKTKLQMMKKLPLIILINYILSVWTSNSQSSYLINKLNQHIINWVTKE